MPRNAIHTRSTEDAKPTDASMRPRQACLGMQAVEREFVGREYRFNEAEASLPRNAGQPNDLRETNRRRFNEAEASLPRNATSILAGTSAAGYCFNEAEASLPRNAIVVVAIRLVARSSFNEAEASLPRNAVSARTAVRRTPLCASMRPRQACLGMPDAA